MVLGKAVRVAELEGAVAAGCAQHACSALAAGATAFWVLDWRGELFVGSLQGFWKGLALRELVLCSGCALGVSFGNHEWTLFEARLNLLWRLIAELKGSAVFLVVLFLLRDLGNLQFRVIRFLLLTLLLRLVVEMLLGCLYELAPSILFISIAIPNRRGKSLLLLMVSAVLFLIPTFFLVLLEANRALLLKGAIAEHDLALDTKLPNLFPLAFFFQSFAHVCSSLTGQCFLDIVYKSDAHF